MALRITKRGRRIRALTITTLVVALAWQVGVRVGGPGEVEPTGAVATPTPSALPRPSPTVTSVPDDLTGFDVVIEGGRVMDPETGLDMVTNVGIVDGTIEAIDTRPMRGRKVIDASGLVVAPGFIDPLSYDPNGYGEWFKISDGVTTVLTMHGANECAAGTFFRKYEQDPPPVHYGGAFDEPCWRARLGVGPYERASDEQIDQLVEIADKQIRKGWIGINFEPEYWPLTSRKEMVKVASVAAGYDMPVFFHARYSDTIEPGTEQEAVAEIIEIGRRSGAAVHVEHINSTGGTYRPARTIKMIEDAQAEGIDVTADLYPYDFWSTFLGSARFDGDWQSRFRISYSDLQIPDSGERLTASTFETHRRRNTVVVAYAIPERSVRTLLEAPWVMLGSDTILRRDEGRHPRGAGSFARLLGRYVREEGVLPLMDALRKITLLPAQRVEEAAPAMRRKGRLQVGMDADITIFDPDTIIDRATVRDPRRHSTGVEWVLVMGELVRTPKGLRRNVRPGQPILSAVALGEATDQACC